MTDERRLPSHPALEVLKRHWAVRMLLVVLPAIVSSVAAYTGATGDAEDRAQVVKHQADRVEGKAGAGYQVTREAIEDLKDQVAQLRAELGALKRAVRAGSKTVIKAAPPPPAAAVAPPLPPTLDQAVQAAKPTSTGAPAEAPKP
jgi:hypothetical protein